MSEAESRQLGEDIKKKGLTSPILLYLDPSLPIKALRSQQYMLLSTDDFLGYDNPIKVESPNDPYEYVISANAHRRYLTAEQKRDLIAKVLQASPEKSDRAIADQMKVDKNVVSRVRQKAEATGAVAPVEKRTGKDGKARKRPEKKQKTAESQRKEEPPSFDQGACHSLEWNEIEGQAETLISVWDKTGPKLRRDFVRARKVEIMRAQQEIGKSAHEPDDGLDIPGFLKRDTKAGAA